MSSKGRTKLKICLSREKDVNEAAGDVRFGVSPQKTGKNETKKTDFLIQIFRNFLEIFEMYRNIRRLSRIFRNSDKNR